MERLNNLTMIVAAAENGGIGSDNKLPWKCPEDMKFFRETTTGNNVIMGWNTYESLGGKPLPNRKNFVISRPDADNLEGFHQYDLPCMLQIVKSTPEEEFYVIGGAKTYALFMEYVRKAFVSTIYDECLDKSMTMDTFIPELGDDFRLQGVMRAHDTCIIKCFVGNGGDT